MADIIVDFVNKHDLDGVDVDMECFWPNKDIGMHQTRSGKDHNTLGQISQENDENEQILSQLVTASHHISIHDRLYTEAKERQEKKQ